MKRFRFVRGLTCLIGVLGFIASPLSPAQQASRLLEYKCYVCHADHEWKSGPSFDAVATVYKRRSHAADELVLVI
ncbi:MAG TPA: hypothetical protein VMV45_03305, partial [Casimicrobiaceae bacterium]|nr:hypothetical protein [Casimicrobiaceae bacterium]